MSQGKPREGNKGGDSLNLHWRFNCRNRHSSGFTTAQPYLNWHCCCLHCCTSRPHIHTAFLHSALAHIHLCGKWVWGAQLLRSFLLFSFVRTVTFSAGLTYLTRLMVRSDKQKCQYKTESRNSLKGTEQEYVWLQQQQTTLITLNCLLLYHSIRKRDSNLNQLFSARNCCYNGSLVLWSSKSQHCQQTLLRESTDSLLAFCKC